MGHVGLAATAPQRDHDGWLQYNTWWRWKLGSMRCQQYHSFPYSSRRPICSWLCGSLLTYLLFTGATHIKCTPAVLHTAAFNPLQTSLQMNRKAQTQHIPPFNRLLRHAQHRLCTIKIGKLHMFLCAQIACAPLNLCLQTWCGAEPASFTMSKQWGQIQVSFGAT